MQELIFNNGPQRRCTKPKYAQTYIYPLPIVTQELPTFLPHNPLSVFRIIYVLFRSFLISSPSHPTPKYGSYLSQRTEAVHVIDAYTIFKLWNMGFFGKGSLSRSEPTWLQRENGGSGLSNENISEEVTRKRREERRIFKLQRARKERQQQRPEAHIETGNEYSNRGSTSAPSNCIKNNRSSPDFVPLNTNSSIFDSPHQAVTIIEKPSYQPTSYEGMNGFLKRSISYKEKFENIASNEVTKDQEHLQLTLQEAFFLTNGLGILDVTDMLTNSILTATNLFKLCCNITYKKQTSHIEPDDPFIVNYVVYHHFRSLGWVVRSGIKFSVDYLLYNRGPPFAHAEFAVVILPEIGLLSNRQEQRDKGTIATKGYKSSWHWLHCVNRVQAQVLKTLLFVYVETPSVVLPPKTSSDISELLKCYKVKEFIWRRWVPNRNRD